MRIAIFGGSFDPVHVGHLAIADEVRSSLGYDEIVFVPSSVPPHKRPSQKVDAAKRVQMVRLAILGNNAFSLSTVEVDRGGVSYTIDTIRTLIAERNPEGRPGLVIGDDLVPGFGRWKEAERIASLVEIVVARRDDRSSDERCGLPEFVTCCSAVNNQLVPISSSQIRDRIADGRSYRYLVPESVYEYIEDNRLYRS
ncbi:nicotinate-nucleotide adenylyltransferase [Salinispira pacifica]